MLRRDGRPDNFSGQIQPETVSDSRNNGPSEYIGIEDKEIHGRRYSEIQRLERKKRFEVAKRRLQADICSAIDSQSSFEWSSGLMGVPITFLSEYSPDQFEIVGTAKTWYERYEPLRTKEYPRQIQVNRAGKRSEVSKLNDGAVVCVSEPPMHKTYYIVDGKYYVQEYARILIRRKRQWK